MSEDDLDSFLDQYIQSEEAGNLGDFFKRQGIDASWFGGETTQNAETAQNVPSSETTNPGETGYVDGSGLVKQKQFGSQTAQNSPLADEVKDILKRNSDYVTDSNMQQSARAAERIAKDGFQKAVTDFVSAKDEEVMSKDYQALGALLMGEAVRNGDVNAQAQIAAKYNEIGTELALWHPASICRVFLLFDLT